MTDAIELIGPHKVEVIINNVLICKRVTKIVEDKIPHITYLSCVAHVIDLCMENIGIFSWNHIVTIFSKSFWHNVQLVVVEIESIYCLVCLVDFAIPTMGIYKKIGQLIEIIKCMSSPFESNKVDIIQILHDRWPFGHIPLYCSLYVWS